MLQIRASAPINFHLFGGEKNTIFFFCVALEPMYDQPKIKCHFIFLKIRTVVNAG